MSHSLGIAASPEESLSPHETVVQAGQPWFHVDWGELWDYRDLIYLLVRRDFVSKYKQTVLGPVWFILQPLLMTAVFTVIFGVVANISTDGLPKTLFYFSGMVMWSYFAQNLNTATTIFTTNAYLFTKVYFPRLVVPLATALSNLFSFAIQFVTFLAFYAWFKLFTAAGAEIMIRPAALLLPLELIHLIVLSLAVSLWMSALTAKYRDFTHLMAFIAQIWLYVTPVVIPISSFPKAWRWVPAVNPMTALVEWFRYAFLGRGTVTLQSIGLSVAITVVLFVSGVAFYQRTARTFADTV
ncbi:MAG: ABC transporter permease [Chthoniobacter sp.]|uniref:ABC transporter permease n=1 Tax=Chthoniobacter sp. TaxID=2510640 RepID=UPI0032A8EAA2